MINWWLQESWGVYYDEALGCTRNNPLNFYPLLYRAALGHQPLTIQTVL